MSSEKVGTIFFPRQFERHSEMLWRPYLKLLRNTTTQPAFTCSKVNNKNTRTMCKICSKFTIKTPKQRYWHHSGIFIVNYEPISHNCSGVYIVDFDQVNSGWGRGPHQYLDGWSFDRLQCGMETKLVPNFLVVSDLWTDECTHYLIL